MKDLSDYKKPKEVEAMIKSLRRGRDKLLIRLLFRTGMRVSEVTSLKKSNIDFEEKVITIVGKGDKSRRVQVNGKTLDSLSRFINRYKPRHFVFENKKTGRPITRQRVFQICKKLKIHPHTLRHSFAVQCIKQGMDIRRLQMLLGHADLSTTSIYLQFKTEDIREEYDRVWEK